MSGSWIPQCCIQSFTHTLFSVECVQSFHKTVERISELTAQNPLPPILITTLHPSLKNFLVLTQESLYLSSMKSIHTWARLLPVIQTWLVTTPTTQTLWLLQRQVCDPSLANKAQSKPVAGLLLEPLKTELGSILLGVEPGKRETVCAGKLYSPRWIHNRI